MTRHDDTAKLDFLIHPWWNLYNRREPYQQLGDKDGSSIYEKLDMDIETYTWHLSYIWGERIDKIALDENHFLALLWAHSGPLRDVEEDLHLQARERLGKRLITAQEGDNMASFRKRVSDAIRWQNTSRLRLMVDVPLFVYGELSGDGGCVEREAYHLLRQGAVYGIRFTANLLPELCGDRLEGKMEALQRQPVCLSF